MGFKIGDKVRIVHSGANYSTYSAFIRKYGSAAENAAWRYGSKPDDVDDDDYTITALHRHESQDDMLAIISKPEGNNGGMSVYVIDVRGLEKVSLGKKDIYRQLCDLLDSHNSRTIVWGVVELSCKLREEIGREEEEIIDRSTYCSYFDEEGEYNILYVKEGDFAYGDFINRVFNLICDIRNYIVEICVRGMHDVGVEWREDGMVELISPETGTVLAVKDCFDGWERNGEIDI